MASLQDKVVIVTGSSSGIGEAIAIKFSSLGSKVTICGRDHEKLKLVLDKILKINGGHTDKVISVQGDLNDHQVRVDIVSQTVEKFGRLDILVANAGILGLSQTVLVVTEELYDTIMNTNLKSVFFLIQQAVPHLEKSKGNIVCISSIASIMAVPIAQIYILSKTALDQLTRCLAVDLGPKGIRVNGVNPGFIATTHVFRQHSDDIQEINGALTSIELKRQPLNTRLTSGEDIAETVTFLASEAAALITGENVKVDGGRNLDGPSDWSDLKMNA